VVLSADAQIDFSSPSRPARRARSRARHRRWSERGVPIDDSGSVVARSADRRLGFLALNALGALFVVGSLVAAWLFRPALGPTATERAEAEPSTS